MQEKETTCEKVVLPPGLRSCVEVILKKVLVKVIEKERDSLTLY